MLWPMSRIPELFTNLRMNFNTYKAKTESASTIKGSRPSEIGYKGITYVIILPIVSLIPNKWHTGIHQRARYRCIYNSI